MRKIIILFLLVIFAIPVFSTTIIINGKKTEFSKIEVKENETVFVPLRDFEKLGLGTISSLQDGSIEFSTPKINFVFFKNSDSVRMNALSLKLPMSTYVEDGKFMVPMIFLIKSLAGEYSQEKELIVEVRNLPINTQTSIKAPVLKEEKTSSAPIIKEEPKESEEVEKTEKIITPYEAPKLENNWFQGTVMAYNKKLNLIDVDLYSQNGKCVQTTKTNNGVFAFKNIVDGKYFIKIDHAKNPSFKTFKTSVFEVKNMEGKKISKPLNITRAIKSNGIKEVKINDATYYTVNWSQVPNTKNYKIVVKSANVKANVFKADAKVEKINVPLSKLSKGQAYAVTVTSYDKYGNLTGESVDSGWTISTP